MIGHGALPSVARLGLEAVDEIDDVVESATGRRHGCSFARRQWQEGSCRSRCRRQAGIAMAGRDVGDDVGGMHAVNERFGAGRLDYRQPIDEHRGEDVLAMPTAIRRSEERHDGRRGRAPPNPVTIAKTALAEMARTKVSQLICNGGR